MHGNPFTEGPYFFTKLGHYEFAAHLPYSFDTDPTLLEEAIGALRRLGKIVQKPAHQPGRFRIDGRHLLTFGQVVALALDRGLMHEFKEAQ